MSQTVLPPTLNLNGAWEDTVELLYTHFEATFKCSPRRRVRNKAVVFDQKVQEGAKEEGFWHVVSSGKGPDRRPDFARARKICWLAPMLDGTAAGLSSWANDEGNGTARLYYWLESFDYVLILKEKPRIVALATAFHVDNDWLRADLAAKRRIGTPI